MSSMRRVGFPAKRDSPRLASPRLASPRLASPRLASPRLASLYSLYGSRPYFDMGSLWLVPLVLGLVGSLTFAEERRYAGWTLSECQVQLGRFDPKSPNAEFLVPALLDVVGDESILAADREPFAAYLARVGRAARPMAPLLAIKLKGRSRPQSDPSEYGWAIRTLALLGREAQEVTPELVAFVQDEAVSVDLRTSAIEALSQIGSAHPDAIPALMSLIQKRPSERQSVTDTMTLQHLAVMGLGIVGPDAGVASLLLIRLVRDQNCPEGTRREAMVALGSFREQGGMAVPVFAEELERSPSPALRDVAALGLVRVGEEGITRALNYLQHPDDEIRWRVASSLGEVTIPSLKQRVAQELVVSAQKEVREKKLQVAMSAAEALRKLDPASEVAVDVSLSVIESAARELRMRATKLLNMTSGWSPEQQARLLRLQQHDDATIRRAARQVKVDFSNAP